MLGSTLFYVGAVAAFVGLLSLIRPLRRLGIRTRRPGMLVAIAGAALALSAMLLPDSTRTTTARDTLIDQWLPEWQFGEYHERRVRASPRQVFAAIRRVRSSDILLFRTLTFIRNPGRQGQSEHMLNPPAETPILDVALSGGFVLLGEDADRELLIGAVVIAPPEIVRAAQQRSGRSLDPELFRTLGRPGFARAVMNFRAIAVSDGWTRLTTETRVQTVDRGTARRFALYWRVIHPGSWIIRWSTVPTAGTLRSPRVVRREAPDYGVSSRHSRRVERATRGGGPFAPSGQASLRGLP